MEFPQRLRSRVVWTVLAGAQIVIAVFGILISQPATAVQSVPYKINFQGRLTDASGNALSDGSYNVKFRFWTTSSGGTNDCAGAQVNCVWEGDRVYGASDHRVQVTNGLFNIQFGDTSKGDPALNPSLFDNQTYANLYLEVELPTPATVGCASNGCSVWSEGAMTPRQPLSSSAYAFNSDTLDGLDSAAFGQLATANSFTDTNTFSKSGGAGVILSGTPAASGSLLQIGSVLSSGNASGTVLGVNTSLTGDLLNLQVSNVTKLKVDNSGNLTLASGAIITVGSSAGTGVTCSGGQFLQNQVTVGGVTTGGTCATPTGTGASTTLNNLGATAINADLVPDTNNTWVLGTDAKAWSIIKVANVDTGTGTTTLNIGTTNATAINLGANGARTILAVAPATTAITADANLIVNSTVSIPSLTSVAFSANSGGSLSGAAGTTYFYKISACLNVGCTSETPASTEMWVNTSSFSPLSTGSLTAPTAVLNASNAGALNQSQVYSYKVTFVSANGETTASPASGNVTTTNSRRQIDLSSIPTGPTGTTARRVYRTVGGGNTYLLVNTGTTLNNNSTTSLTDGTADNTLGAGTPSANTATTNANTVNITFPSFPGATGGYRIYRGTSTRGENAYQTAASSPFTDTGAAGTSGSFIDDTAGRVGIGTTSPGYALDVAGNVSASGAYLQSGNVGQTSSCGAGSTFSGLTVSGGIVTATGSCASIGGGSASATLQSAYDNSTIPQIALSTAGGALTVADTSAGLGAALFEVTDNAGTTKYLSISATGLTTTGSISIATGQHYQINGTQISTAALSDVSSITMQGNTFNGASQLVQLNGSTQLPSVSGTNLTNLNPTNLATGSGAVTLASASGQNLTLNTGGSGGTNVVLGSNVTTLQKAATALSIDLAAAATSTLTITNSDASNIANLSVEGGLTIGSGKAVTVGSTSGVDKTCSGGQILDGITTLGGVVTGGTCTTPVGGGGASTTLNNLIDGSVAINTSLVSDATNTDDLGSSSITWRNGYFGTAVQAPLLQSAAATALTITANAASTWSTSSGQLKIQSGSGTLSLGSTTAITADGALSIDSNTTSALSLGTTASAKTVTIGNATGATQVDINTGTNGLNIGDNANAKSIDIGGVTSDGGDTINIATNATTADTVTIGSTNASSKVILNGGASSTTSNLGVQLGGGFSTSDTSQVNIVLDSNANFADSGTCSTSVNGGALYYNSNTNAIRTCIANTGWEDVMTTAGMGILMFGVVPDSSTANNIGDLAGVGASGATSSGPCKVYIGSSNANASKTIRWTGCTAYSGGRKVVIPAQSTDFGITTSASSWAHVCLNGANNQVSVSAFGTETANLPAFNASAPVVCLADIQTGTGQGLITGIFDTRTFTSTDKTFGQVTTAIALGVPTIPSTTNLAQVGASATANISGVVVASAGTTTGTPNVIIANGGPVWTKATGGTAGGVVITSTTAGRVTTGTSVAGPYGDLGLARTTYNATCTAGTAANCQTSIFYDFFPR